MQDAAMSGGCHRLDVCLFVMGGTAGELTGWGPWVGGGARVWMGEGGGLGEF